MKIYFIHLIKNHIILYLYIYIYIYKTETFTSTTIFYVNTTQYLKNKIKNTIFLSKTHYLSSFFLDKIWYFKLNLI